MFETLETEIEQLPDSASLSELVKILNKDPKFINQTAMIEQIELWTTDPRVVMPFTVSVKEFTLTEQLGQTHFGKYNKSPLFNVASFKDAVKQGMFKGM